MELTPSRRKHWMRACAIAMGGMALLVLVASTGLSWWRVLLALLLLACPATAIWTALRFGRCDDFKPENSPGRNASDGP